MAVGPHDYKEAVKWFRLAAEKGNRDAQHALGTMYENGQGCGKTTCWPACGSSSPPIAAWLMPQPHSRNQKSR